MMRYVEGMTAVRRLVPRAAGMCIAVAGVLACTRLWPPAALAGADDVAGVDSEPFRAKPARTAALHFGSPDGMAMARLPLPLALLAFLTGFVTGGGRCPLGMPIPEPWRRGSAGERSQ